MNWILETSVGFGFATIVLLVIDVLLTIGAVIEVAGATVTTCVQAGVGDRVIEMVTVCGVGNVAGADAGRMHPAIQTTLTSRVAKNIKYVIFTYLQSLF
jgi:hypothetical protein